MYLRCDEPLTRCSQWLSCDSAGGKLVFTDSVVGLVIRIPGSCFRDLVSPFAPAIRKRRRLVVDVRARFTPSLPALPDAQLAYRLLKRLGNPLTPR
jgi:hypothetical protein